MTTSERVTASLLGLACGDALGAPFEGQDAVDVARVRQWASAEQPLLWTDDTAMAIVLADHLCRNAGTVVDEMLAVDFACAWRREPHRGHGPARRRSSERR